MKFTKLSEIVIHTKNPGYFKLRTFEFDLKSENPISDFLQTNFAVWKEEYQNDVSVEINNTKSIVDWNFHGLYDIKLLKAEHFINISFNDLQKSLKDYIVLQIGFDSQLGKIEMEIEKMNQSGNNFYLLRDLDLSFNHKWSVFEHFISGFVVNVLQNQLIAFEFGLE